MEFYISRASASDFAPARQLQLKKVDETCYRSSVVSCCRYKHSRKCGLGWSIMVTRLSGVRKIRVATPPGK